MPRPVKPERITPTSADQHIDAIIGALETLDANPYTVMRHYVHAVLKKHSCNLSTAARAMRLHRRTLQRLLDKRVT